MKYISLVFLSLVVGAGVQAECTLKDFRPEQALVINTDNSLAQPLDLKELLSINNECEGRSLDYILIYTSGQGTLRVIGNGQPARIGDVIVNRENIRGDMLDMPNNNFELGPDSGSLELKVSPYTAGGLLKIYRIEAIENRRR